MPGASTLVEHTALYRLGDIESINATTEIVSYELRSVWKELLRKQHEIGGFSRTHGGRALTPSSPRSGVEPVLPHDDGIAKSQKGGEDDGACLAEPSGAAWCLQVSRDGYSAAVDGSGEAVALFDMRSCTQIWASEPGIDMVTLG